MEFHVSRAARQRYGIDESLFTLSANVILPDFRATRQLASRMNERRNAAVNPELTVQAGSLNAMGLIDEILHAVVRLYREQRDPTALADALTALQARLGDEALDTMLRSFAERFPPVAVHRGELSVDEYLARATAGIPNREVALEELLLLWLANANPAFGPFRELFDDVPLAESTAYRTAIDELKRFFAGRPTFGPENLDLFTFLRRPAELMPDSLADQLGYIREHWGLMLATYLDRLIVTLDVLKEDERAMFMRFAGNTGGAGRGHGGPGLAGGGLDVEYERFSQDRDWMPKLVLLAKSTFVWLDQLSRSYGRHIHRLDEIPDEELDTMARWGITGLWLIGLWERSRASQRIKQMRGNPDAVASAYSLRDYVIADELGGPDAYERLRQRASQRGIRLASDMVPNHMGIDSRWVMEHPDWFLSLDHSPYPSYTFNGPDLSDDSRVGIFIEDHYYDSTDAAVVFRRLDRWSGQERYIYHGNDGTSMPWNDTAQLDYSRADVREAVIQTVLHVARQFPVIRFDAAMTLARRHVQRLWFPEPGSGGAIPSRAEHGMNREQFEQAMPVEFWREVVDRVAAEVPDTLLLAEAFWLMEGYFVRTLGMHRVYNSAFMHMLRDEDNAGYRKVMKDTLEFDPEILKRYVNFMNNPDEATAIEQFGAGDKYFGVATLLVTMPGLPMLGHGQVEGFGEKYGMEYRRAYRDERPNLGLIAEHERRIFPLVHRRRLFAEVNDFLLYDFIRDDSSVDENVFAFSNRVDGDRSLVVYHNRFGSTRGRIRDSVPYAEKDGGGKRVVRRSVADGLGGIPLDTSGATFLVARDVVSGLEYLRDAPTVRDSGWEVELDAYRCFVLVDWREMHDGPNRQLAQLAMRVGLGGVPSVEEALRDLLLEPLHLAVARFVNGGVLRWIMDTAAPEAGAAPEARVGLEAAPEAAAAPEPTEPASDVEPAAAPTSAQSREALLADVEAQVSSMLEALADAAGKPEARDRAHSTAETLRRRLGVALEIAAGTPGPAPAAASRASQQAIAAVRNALGRGPAVWGPLVGWLGMDAVGRALWPDDVERHSRVWFDESRLGRLLHRALLDLGLDDGAAWYGVQTVRLLLALPGVEALEAPAAERPARLVYAWFQDDDMASHLGVNRYEGVTWFNREAFEQVLDWLLIVAAVSERVDLPSAVQLVSALRVAADAAGYQVGRLLELVRA